jgi:Flp pilus assembly protein TadB
MSQLEKTRSERIDVDRALQHAGRHESRRTVSWLLATAIATGAVVVVIRHPAVPIVVAAFGVVLMLWSMRLQWGGERRLARLQEGGDTTRTGLCRHAE